MSHILELHAMLVLYVQIEHLAHRTLGRTPSVMSHTPLGWMAYLGQSFVIKHTHV
ncbi:hypothetical protein HanIR_Chr14g0704231 [Helianthus annuus]|nr:hypothetical protein HanIR_Chr14g0704231 [Helianthus annuus]